MLISGIPAKFPIVWGASAVYINAIPSTSQIGTNPGYASLPDGFVPLNQTPVGAGGIPPRIQDMNGILNELAAWSQWQQAGGPITYDSAFQTAVGGYPSGSVVQSATTAGKYWRSTADNNTTNPDTGGAGWAVFFSSPTAAAGTGGTTFATMGYVDRRSGLVSNSAQSNNSFTSGAQITATNTITAPVSGVVSIMASAMFSTAPPGRATFIITVNGFQEAIEDLALPMFIPSSFAATQGTGYTISAVLTADAGWGSAVEASVRIVSTFTPA